MDTYAKATTYQATVRFTDQNGANKTVATIATQMVCDKEGKSLFGNASVSVVTTISGKPKVHKQQFVDDGKLLTTIDHDAKTYSTSEHTSSPLVSLFSLATDAFKSIGTFRVRTVPSGNLTVYILSGKANDQTVEIRVDKGTGFFLSFRSSTGKGPSAETSAIEVVSQKFDAPIPDSVFKWEPAPGYKKVNP